MLPGLRSGSFHIRSEIEMKARNFKISGSVIEEFPEISVHAIKVTISDQSLLVPEIDALSKELVSVREDLLVQDQITSVPAIFRWREAYSKLGVKPSKYYSSIESLLRRVKNDSAFLTGIPAVDAYNLASIVNHAPIGAYDLDKMPEGHFSLRHAHPMSDTYTPLGGQAKDFPLNDNLVVYALDTRVLCWGFNTRDSTDCAVSIDTKNILFLSETTSHAGVVNSQQALNCLQRVFRNTASDVSGMYCFDAKMSDGQI
jgi:lysyl-tRNA synthetase class 2